MVQAIIGIAAAALFTCAAAAYMKYSKRSHIISMIIVMAVLLLAIVSVQFFFGTAGIIRALELLTMAAVCFPAAWIDASEKKIPNTLIVSALALRLLYYVIWLFTDSGTLLAALGSDCIALLIIIVFCAIGLLFIRNGIGMGDVKLLLVLALLVGSEGIISVLFFTMVAALFMGLYALIIKKEGKDAEIPFAPAILTGTYITAIVLSFN